MASSVAAFLCRRLCRTTHIRRWCHAAPRLDQGVWKVMSAVCVERPPVIVRDMTPLESRFSTQLQQVELDKSVLCDHELRHKQDIAMAEERRIEGDLEDKGVAVETALELEDNWEAELATYQTSKVEKLKPHNKNLDKKVVLLVRRLVGDKQEWLLPEDEVLPGDTLKQTAERILSTLYHDTTPQLISSAPCAFYSYNFPPAVKESTGCLGAKIFIHKAVTYDDTHSQLSNIGRTQENLTTTDIDNSKHKVSTTTTRTTDNVDLTDKTISPISDNAEQNDVSPITDYKWVTKKELLRYVPRRYGKVISDALMCL